MRLNLLIVVLILVSLINPVLTFSSILNSSSYNILHYYYCTIYTPHSDYQANFTVISSTTEYGSGNITISYKFNDKLVEYRVSINVTISNDIVNIRFNTSIPNLIQIIGESNKEKAIIWARESNTSISLFSTHFLFINDSGKLIFQFANGPGIYNESIYVNRTLESSSFSLTLLNVSKMEIETSKVNTESITGVNATQLEYFKNYLVKQMVFNKEVDINESPMITFIELNEHQVLPSIVYVGNNNSVRGFTLSIYGINSSILGYVYNIYSQRDNKFFSVYDIKYPTVVSYNYKYIYIKIHNLLLILGYNQSSVVTFISNSTIINSIRITFEHVTKYGVLFMINVANEPYILNNGSIENVTIGKVVYYSPILYTNQGDETEVVIVSYTSHTNYYLFLVNVSNTSAKVINVYNSDFKPINGSFFYLNSSNLAILIPYNSSSMLYLVFNKGMVISTASNITITPTSNSTKSITTTVTTNLSAIVIPLMILILVLGPIIVLAVSRK